MIACSLSGVKRVLCLGAHSDDIGIGYGGLLARTLFQSPVRQGSQTQRQRFPWASAQEDGRGEIVSRRIPSSSRYANQRVLQATQESFSRPI